MFSITAFPETFCIVSLLPEICPVVVQKHLVINILKVLAPSNSLYPLYFKGILVTYKI